MFNKNGSLFVNFLWVLLFLLSDSLYAQNSFHYPVKENVTNRNKNESLLISGVPWFDDQGKIVNAHGACIVKEGGTYYLFGEYKTDSVNRFIGFSCYSSQDLVNWKFERLALPPQKAGLLGPGRIGERVKVMKCPSTGEFVMYMHTDDLGYRDPNIGYATSKTINGEYEFKGAVLYNGAPIKRWDMGTFQDNDGKGYLLIHHGDIYRMSEDYHKAEKKVASDITGSGESPAMFKKDGVYYLLSSNLTSWERNDNMYHTAPRIAGPWTKRGLFCPQGSLTHNSQCSFVFPLVRGTDTTFLYMGDRWSFPKQADAATQVWQPLKIENRKLSIPSFLPIWNVHSNTPYDYHSTKSILLENELVSNKKGDFINIKFKGNTKLAIIGESGPDGGYARFTILDSKNNKVHDSMVDFYSKVQNKGIRFVTPILQNQTYTLKIEVSGEQGVWTDKSKTRFGSTGYWIKVYQSTLLQ